MLDLGKTLAGVVLRVAVREAGPDLPHPVDVQRVPERRWSAPLVRRRGGVRPRVRSRVRPPPTVVGRSGRRWGNGLRPGPRKAIPSGVGGSAPVVERVQLIRLAVLSERVAVRPGCTRRNDLGGASRRNVAIPSQTMYRHSTRTQHTVAAHTVAAQSQHSHSTVTAQSQSQSAPLATPSQMTDS